MSDAAEELKYSLYESDARVHVPDSQGRPAECRFGDMFEDSRIVLFGLPGAFTPTCTKSQVPQYEAKFEEFMELDIDDVICTSVNDIFVMQAWFDKLGIEKLGFVADGNAELARELNMLVEKYNLGLGERSWRYAMVINEDGEIEKVFAEPGIEDNCMTDPYEESKPEKVLEYLRN